MTATATATATNAGAGSSGSSKYWTQPQHQHDLHQPVARDFGYGRQHASSPNLLPGGVVGGSYATGGSVYSNDDNDLADTHSFLTLDNETDSEPIGAISSAYAQRTPQPAPVSQPVAAPVFNAHAGISGNNRWSSLGNLLRRHNTPGSSSASPARAPSGLPMPFPSGPALASGGHAHLTSPASASSQFHASNVHSALPFGPPAGRTLRQKTSEPVLSTYSRPARQQDVHPYASASGSSVRPLSIAWRESVGQPTKPVFQLAPAPGPKRVANGVTPISASAALGLVASSSASTSANVTFPGTSNGLAGSASAPYRLGSGQGAPSASGAFVNRSVSPNFSSSAARPPANGLYSSPSRTHLNNSVFASPSTAQNGQARPFPSTADGAQGTASPRGTPTRKGSFGLLRGLKISLSSPNLRAAFRGGESPSPVVASGRAYAAESWCDALFFPKPRMRAHVISPPSSPGVQALQERAAAAAAATGAGPSEAGKRDPNLHPLEVIAQQVEEQERAEKLARQGSRLRKRSRSLPRSSGEETRQRSATIAAPVASSSAAPRGRERAATDARDRPTQHRQRDRTASDVDRPPLIRAHTTNGTQIQELQLPNPPPTLASVVHAGEQLDAERTEWSRKANSSFLNKRSRSLSRSTLRNARVRAKSDVAAGWRNGEGPGPAERVVIRAFAQDGPKPRVAAVSFGHASRNGGSSHHSRPSNANAPSLGRSVSTGSVKGHRHSSSWGRTKDLARKVGCVDPEVTPMDERPPVGTDGVLLNASRRSDADAVVLTGGTAKIRVRSWDDEDEDDVVDIAPSTSSPPTTVLSHGGQFAAQQRLAPTGDRATVTPSPVGIALTTPLGSERDHGHSQQQQQPQFILDSHPYAAYGGLSRTNDARDSVGSGTKEGAPASGHPFAARAVSGGQDWDSDRVGGGSSVGHGSMNLYTALGGGSSVGQGLRTTQATPGHTQQNSFSSTGHTVATHHSVAATSSVGHAHVGIAQRHRLPPNSGLAPATIDGGERTSQALSMSAFGGHRVQSSISSGGSAIPASSSGDHAHVVGGSPMHAPNQHAHPAAPQSANHTPHASLSIAARHRLPPTAMVTITGPDDDEAEREPGSRMYALSRSGIIREVLPRDLASPIGPRQILPPSPHQPALESSGIFPPPSGPAPTPSQFAAASLGGERLSAASVATSTTLPPLPSGLPPVPTPPASWYVDASPTSKVHPPPPAGHPFAAPTKDSSIDPESGSMSSRPLSLTPAPARRGRNARAYAYAGANAGGNGRTSVLDVEEALSYAFRRMSSDGLRHSEDMYDEDEDLDDADYQRPPVPRVVSDASGDVIVFDGRKLGQDESTDGSDAEVMDISRSRVDSSATDPAFLHSRMTSDERATIASSNLMRSDPSQLASPRDTLGRASSVTPASHWDSAAASPLPLPRVSLDPRISADSRQGVRETVTSPMTPGRFDGLGLGFGLPAPAPPARPTPSRLDPGSPHVPTRSVARSISRSSTPSPVPPVDAQEPSSPLGQSRPKLQTEGRNSSSDSNVADKRDPHSVEDLDAFRDLFWQPGNDSSGRLSRSHSRSGSLGAATGTSIASHAAHSQDDHTPIMSNQRPSMPASFTTNVRVRSNSTQTGMRPTHSPHGSGSSLGHEKQHYRLAIGPTSSPARSRVQQGPGRGSPIPHSASMSSLRLSPDIALGRHPHMADNHSPSRHARLRGGALAALKTRKRSGTFGTNEWPRDVTPVEQLEDEDDYQEAPLRLRTVTHSIAVTTPQDEEIRSAHPSFSAAEVHDGPTAAALERLAVFIKHEDESRTHSSTSTSNQLLPPDFSSHDPRSSSVIGRVSHAPSSEREHDGRSQAADDGMRPDSSVNTRASLNVPDPNARISHASYATTNTMSSHHLSLIADFPSPPNQELMSQAVLGYFALQPLPQPGPGIEAVEEPVYHAMIDHVDEDLTAHHPHDRSAFAARLRDEFPGNVTPGGGNETEATVSRYATPTATLRGVAHSRAETSTSRYQTPASAYGLDTPMTSTDALSTFLTPAERPATAASTATNTTLPANPRANRSTFGGDGDLGDAWDIQRRANGYDRDD